VDVDGVESHADEQFAEYRERHRRRVVLCMRQTTTASRERQSSSHRNQSVSPFTGTAVIR